MGSRTLVSSTHTYYYNAEAGAVPGTSHQPQARQAIAPSTPLPTPRRSITHDSYTNVTRLALEPRPFAELEMERKVLQDALNRIDGRARGLVRELAAADDAIQQVSGRKRREAESQYGRLKNHMADTMEEEKAVWLHLAELHIEIQSRERWCAVWQGHERTNSWPAESQGVGGLQFGQQDKGAGTQDHQAPQPCSPSPLLTMGADHDADAGQAHISNPPKTRRVHQDSAKNINSTSTRVYKRNSLPSLQYVWSDTSNETGHICSGYGAEN